MSFENFKIIISRFPDLKVLELYNWGEPFLNPEIFEMIRYTKEKKIFTQIHTNLSLNRDDSFFKSLALNCPHKLIISLDGASAESYNAFRVRGDFDLVIENIKKIRRLQHENRTTSFIQWKYIVNAFNEHEIPKARILAAELGIRIQFVPMSLGDDMIDLNHHDHIDIKKQKWLPANPEYVLPKYKCQFQETLRGPCPYLFKTIVINPDGGIFPCCYATNKNNTFGNLIDNDLESVWYNDHYEHSRELFTGKKYIERDCSTICDSCNNFEKHRLQIQ
jgi:radical SAM protein with 4Fe4S-binding SPASM domain